MLYFAEVVERGGFAAAGRALGVANRDCPGVCLIWKPIWVLSSAAHHPRAVIDRSGEAYLRHCQAIREVGPGGG